MIEIHKNDYGLMFDWRKFDFGFKVDQGKYLGIKLWVNDLE